MGLHVAHGHRPLSGVQMAHLRHFPRPTATVPIQLLYLAAWPGLAPDEFIRPLPRPLRPSRTDWFPPARNLLVGLLLVTLVAPRIATPLLRGWAGMIGTILVLHFGMFHPGQWGRVYKLYIYPTPIPQPRLTKAQRPIAPKTFWSNSVPRAAGVSRMRRSSSATRTNRPSRALAVT